MRDTRQKLAMLPPKKGRRALLIFFKIKKRSNVGHYGNTMSMEKSRKAREIDETGVYNASSPPVLHAATNMWEHAAFRTIILASETLAEHAGEGQCPKFGAASLL